jgi:lipopolysaccharide/colanic/teichoic acid biosynthesis glycosyltransferase
MGRRGHEWVLTHATRSALAARYLGVLADLARSRVTGFGGALKGAFDRVAAFFGLLALSPVLVLVSAAIAATLGRPILFRPERPGHRGRPFRLVKFRTMRSGAGADAARLTTLGRFLRAASLDELPELWNVLCGEMSLVGPRPLLMQYLSRYSARQGRRHDVKPGITGWAQVNGRNALTWENKLEFDVWYVENWSLGLDARILARTLGQVLLGRGVAHPGSATMPEFMGTAGQDPSGGEPRG